MIQTLLEHFGVAVAAITGVLAARGKGVDLFGVLVLALVTAFGGGTVRDLLVGDLPVAWLRHPAFLANATLTALATFFVRRLRELPREVLLVADALALALFTIIGVKKGLAYGLAPSVAILLGVVTGVAGGILRDVLTGEVPFVFQPQIHLYATAALGGAAVFVLLRREWPREPEVTLLGTGVVFLLRLLGIRLRLVLPVFAPEPAGKKAD